MNALHRIALLALLTLSGATLAADPAPVPAPAPAPAAKPVPNTHTVIINGKPQTFYNLPGAPAGDDVSAAYQFRTRILVSPPSCERFAAQADWMFLSSTTADEIKAEQLKKIEADATAAGCVRR